MPFSAAPRLEAMPDPAETARVLAGPIRSMERLSGGGNNRIYRVETADGAYALKCYGSTERLAREYGGLSFLAGIRAGRLAVPRPKAAAPDQGAALYEWIDGTAVSRAADGRREDDIAQAVAFAASLAGHRRAEGAAALAEAAEACLSLTGLLDQIENRFARLSGVDDATLGAFLRADARPVIDRARTRALTGYAAAGLGPSAPLESALRTLSPSDFGFHNALRRRDGGLVFLDFEYFGWDDPVKLTADLFWHPAFALASREQAAWHDGMNALFAADPAFAARLRAQLPLYGLRWTMILLNEFLPERWERRLFAGTSAGWSEAKAAQLSKARLWLREAHRLTDGPDGDVRSSFPLLADR